MFFGNREMSVYYGSQTGNATYFASMFANEAREHNWDANVQDLIDFNPVSLRN